VEHSATAPGQAWFELDESRSALQRLGPRRATALIAALVLLFIGLRCVNLAADPPINFGTRPTRELIAEPAAKSHEARNYALFGSYHLNEADDYQFWRAQSPVWVYPLTAFFKLFGTNWPQLRLFSTLYSAAGLAMLLAIAVRFASPFAVAFIGGLLACDSMYFHYSRAGLIEPAVNTWLVACMFGLVLAERQPLWLLLSHWTLALAFFTKQAALVAMPVVALATAWVLFRVVQQRPDARRIRIAVFGNALLIIGLVTLYVLNSDYWRAVEHNVGHVLLGSDAPPEHRYSGLSSIIQRFTDGRYRHFFATVAVTGPLALLAAATLGYELVRRRRLPYPTLVLVGWFLCAFAAMFAIAWSALRFWTMVVLPAALIAGFALDSLFAAAQRHGLVRLRPLAIVCALAVFGVHAFLLREPLFAPRYTLRDGAKAIEQAIGPGPATVLGAQSPGLVLGTPYKNFYLRSKFNATRDQLEKLAPTHFVFVANGDGSQTILRRELPSVAAALVPILMLKVRGVDLKLYAAEASLAGKSARVQ
jgi:4-amino-4-deoxy-L-arabinose transferase-like glycosyltransferase